MVDAADLKSAGYCNRTGSSPVAGISTSYDDFEGGFLRVKNRSRATFGPLFRFSSPRVALSEPWFSLRFFRLRNEAASLGIGFRFDASSEEAARLASRFQASPGPNLSPVRGFP